jgi:outer membrane autotransporter protein
MRRLTNVVGWAGGLFVCLALTLPLAAQVAGEKTWSNTAGGGVGDGDNWVGGVAPIAGDILIFTGSHDVNPEVGVNFDQGDGFEYGGIIFNKAAGRFELYGGGNSISLTADGSIINNSPDVSLDWALENEVSTGQFMDFDIVMLGDATFNAAAGSLWMDGALTLGADNTLTKTGSHELTLQGLSADFLGTLVVDQGTLLLDPDGGDTALYGNVVINSGASLYALGAIGDPNDVIAGGNLTLNDGSHTYIRSFEDYFIPNFDNVDTFTVRGDLTVHSGATGHFRVVYDGMGGIAADTLNVGGVLSVETGSKIAYSINDFNLITADPNAVGGAIVDTVILVNHDNTLLIDGAAPGIGADINDVVTLVGPALLEANLTADLDSLDLNITGMMDPRTFARQHGINKSLGKALGDLFDTVLNDPGSTPEDIQSITDVLNLTTEQLTEFINQINDGVQGLSAAGVVNVQMVQTFNQILTNHLAARRDNLPVYAMQDGQSQMSMIAGLTSDPFTLSQVAASEQPATEQSAEKPMAIAQKDWALFAKVYGVFGDRDTSVQVNGYSADTYGVQFGADYQLNENWIVGLAIDYARTDISLDNGLGGIDVDTIRIGPFASYFNEKWYVDAALTYGYHTNDSTSNNGVLGTSTADYDASDITFLIGGGYKFQLNENWTLSPTGSLRFMHYASDSYTDSKDMSVDDYDFNTLHSRLGVKLTGQLKTANLLLIPELALGWEHEYLSDDSSINASIDGAYPFTVDPATADENSVYFGVGLTAVINESWSTFVRYEGNVGDETQSHAITGGVRFEF